ncbi:MAG: RHS repeat domain-containing protein, partial [Pseudomonas putida]
FTYDDGDRLLSIARQPTGIGKQLGMTEEKLEYTYDLLGRLTKEITPAGTLGYEYDPLSNLTTLTLPDGRKLDLPRHGESQYFFILHIVGRI